MPDGRRPRGDQDRELGHGGGHTGQEDGTTGHDLPIRAELLRLRSSPVDQPGMRRDRREARGA